MKLRLKGLKNVYEEIAEQYTNYVMLGVLKEGDKLPSCRELAIELGINPNTVERAYSLLESEGLVIKIPKKGIYVANIIPCDTMILEQAQKQLQELKSAGVSYEDMLKTVECVYKGGVEKA